MSKKVKVYLNKKDGSRQLVEAELVKENATTVVVKLKDGHVITRKKTRDMEDK